MAKLLDFVLARSSCRLVTEQSVQELVAKLESAMVPDRKVAFGYMGQVNDSGFAVQRVGKDSPPAVIIRGWFEESGAATVTHVTLRHRWHMVLVGWLFVLVGCIGAVGAIALRDIEGLLGAGLFAGMAALWHHQLFTTRRWLGNELLTLLLS